MPDNRELSSRNTRAPRRKPPWIRVKAPTSTAYNKTRGLMRRLNLNTVCEEASCPNIGECWADGHATVMILGDTCTRACTFCNVKTGLPQPINLQEPQNVADSVRELGLKHVVITSVDRDDLEDGGAQQFVRVINAIRNKSSASIEVLTPDFLRKPGAVEAIVEAKPDVYNHNLETVPRLYAEVRPGARYFHSLKLLSSVKEMEPQIFTKSGIMVGLGESRNEVHQVLDDLRAADVDFVTMGQYLQPTPNHRVVDRYIEPDEFALYGAAARGKGFLMVSATPLTRSSYHAGSDFERLKANRAAHFKAH